MIRTVHIVVVHGIGQQKVGGTVARWAGAVELFHRSSGRRTHVVRSQLKSAPAHATVKVGVPGSLPDEPRHGIGALVEDAKVLLSIDRGRESGSAVTTEGTTAGALQTAPEFRATDPDPVEGSVETTRREEPVAKADREATDTEQSTAPGQTAEPELEDSGNPPQDGNPPLHANVADGKLDYHIVEAHWADAFTEPSPSRLLRWLLLVGPGLAMIQAALLIRASKRRDRHGNARQPQLSRRAAGYRVITVLLPVVAGILLLVAAAPLVVLVIGALLVASVIPVASVRKAVGGILGILGATIGDAYLFVADPVSRSAMCTTVEDCLRAQYDAKGQGEKGNTNARESEPVILIGHSQGAAVMHRALVEPGDDGLPSRVKGVITIGSGLGRLTQAFGLNPPSWTYVANTLALIGWVAVGVQLLTDVPMPVWGGLGGFVVAATATLVSARYWWARSERVPGPLALDGKPWLDVWAPTDLVPSGAVFSPNGQENYLPVNVPGELSALRDHTHYADDLAETMPAVIAFIDQVAWSDEEKPRAPIVEQLPSLRNSPPIDGRYPGRGKRRTYRSRDYITLLLRIAPFAAALTLLFRASGEDISGFGHWLVIAAPNVLTETVGTVVKPVTTTLGAIQSAWLEPPDGDTILGVLAVLAIGFLATLPVRWTFAAFQGSETRRWLKSGGLNPWGNRWALALLVLGLISATEVAAFYSVGVQPHWTAGQASEAYIAAVADGNTRRICHVLSPTGVNRLAAAVHVSDGDCVDVAEAYVDQLCAKARTAFPDATVTIEKNKRGYATLTSSSWVPEGPPRCPNAQVLPMLLPSEVQRFTDGNRRPRPKQPGGRSGWLVTDLCDPTTCTAPT